MEHTKGPWVYTFDHGNKSHCIQSLGCDGHPVVFYFRGNGPLRLRDVKLIEAAPDLLDAARDALDVLVPLIDNDFGNMPPVVIQKLEAAIAKATGK
jgi:hypothetical protein